MYPLQQGRCHSQYTSQYVPRHQLFLEYRVKGQQADRNTGDLMMRAHSQDGQNNIQEEVELAANRQEYTQGRNCMQQKRSCRMTGLLSRHGGNEVRGRKDRGGSSRKIAKMISRICKHSTTHYQSSNMRTGARRRRVHAKQCSNWDDTRARCTATPDHTSNSNNGTAACCKPRKLQEL
jgi:hypothetical protein